MSFHFRPNQNFSRIIELTPQLRREIEATVEQLIAILDLFDGDENLEEDDHGEECGDAEPSLGWRNSGSQAASDFTAYQYLYGAEDTEEDAGDMPEWDLAEHGIADHDALCDPELTLMPEKFGFDGSGVRIAKKILKTIR